MNNELQDFLLDIDCLDELTPWVGQFNIFDVLKISRTEIRHSNTLAWLLDTNENHGLGNAFLRGIIQRLVENDSDGRYDVFQLLLLDLYDFVIYREYKNIDILLISQKEKTLFAIENKVGSHEHSNQLNRYRKILESEYEDYNRVYIFLTPDGEEPSDVENWDVFTYYDVVDVLENVSNKIELHLGVKLMIQNYIEVIRRDIVKDQQLIEICNKIYNKHKKALDMIFKYKTDGADVIKNTLTQLAEDGVIVYYPEWNYSFQTDELNEILPYLKEPISSWNTYNVASYWFEVKDGKFAVIFELSGSNVPEETMIIMQKMIDVLKTNDSRKKEFKFKRLYRSKWYELNETEDDVELVKVAVNEVITMQTKLFKDIGAL